MHFLNAGAAPRKRWEHTALAEPCSLNHGALVWRLVIFLMHCCTCEVLVSQTTLILPTSLTPSLPAQSIEELRYLKKHVFKADS